MKTISTSGKCELCGGPFSKGSMKGHLRKCKQLKSSATNSGNECFHIVVQGGYRNIYWLHLAVPKDLPLTKLDNFLRGTWLECCGHMSAFTIAGNRYAASPMNDPAFGLKERSLKVPIGTVLREGTKFSHEYDYGSTTLLSLEVAGLLHLDDMPKDIQLLARNIMPEILCVDCGAAATQICTQCSWKGRGLL